MGSLKKFQSIRPSRLANYSWHIYTNIYERKDFLTLNRHLAPPPIVFSPSTLIFQFNHREIFWLLINSNLKEFFVNFFFMHRVGYRTVKSPECVKIKSKIAHIFFRTKATDLKTIFLKSPCKMGVETCVTLWYLF